MAELPPVHAAVAVLAQVLRGNPADAQLDVIADELDRLGDIEERAREVAALGLPVDSPHLRAGDTAGVHVRTARHILGEPA